MYKQANYMCKIYKKWICSGLTRTRGEIKKERKKNITGKIEDLPYYRTGRSNKQ